MKPSIFPRMTTQLFIYLPADEAAATALEKLAGRHPGALRAVSG